MPLSPAAMSKKTASLRPGEGRHAIVLLGVSPLSVRTAPPNGADAAELPWIAAKSRVLDSKLDARKS
jgi:hypothetical protein